MQRLPIRIIRRHLPQQGLNPQAHCCQRIVELVGNTGRELAHRRQLGYVPQLLRHHRHLFVFRPQRGLRPLPFQDLQAQLSRMLLDGLVQPEVLIGQRHLRSEGGGQLFVIGAELGRPQFIGQV